MLPGRHVVAGAAGMMGTFALLRLRDQAGVEVIATTHERSTLVTGANISCISANLTRMEDCRRALEGADYLWLLAARLSTAPVVARNPVAHMTSNMQINANMLEAAWEAGVKKALWLSSFTAYPDKEEPLKETDMFSGDPPKNHFAVGWMSRYTEVLCRMYATILPRKMTTIILRPTTIFGEYEDFHFETAHMLPALVRKAVERQCPIEVWGDGTQTRDLIYGDDVIDACLLALDKVEGCGVFNIGSGKEYTVNQVLTMILDIDNYHDARIVHNSKGPASVMRKTLDLTRANAILGFTAKTSLPEGVRKMVEWYRRNPVER